MLRLGLVCQFIEANIKFKFTTYKNVSKLPKQEILQKISSLCLYNVKSLLEAIEYCYHNNIGCFRINSKILPLKTHPKVKYELEELPDHKKIKYILEECKQKAQKYNIRLTFHPDQFVILNSPNNEIIEKSIEDLLYHCEVAEMVGADVITIHAGGAYNDKKESLKRLSKTLQNLDPRILKLLAIENDDKIYTPKDLISFCKTHNLPFVYDVLHHRCNPDNLQIEEVTQMAIETWDREPLFHLSSLNKEKNLNCHCSHADYIDINDFPKFWKDLSLTIEIEAKYKELAIKKFQKDLEKI
ncbi:MAG: UV DNA damage repair endonuclease UvsE [bacterium]